MGKSIGTWHSRTVRIFVQFQVSEREKKRRGAEKEAHEDIAEIP
jgi:hypothetical protein